jgi:uncharacterized membrane protein YraQ (UPF0718 family)
MPQAPLAKISRGPDESIALESRTPLISLILRLTVAASVWVIIYHFLGPVTAWLTHTAFGFADSSRAGSTVEFFIFEAPKVLMLLVAVVFIVGIIRSFFTPERTRQMLAGKREFVGNIMASGLGIVTPFCSCSAIPLFIGFVETGVPLGVTLSFLIAAPMINEVAVVLLLGMFGIRIAAIYVLTGLVIAVLSGLIIGKLPLEGYIEDWVHTVKLGENQLTQIKRTWPDRVEMGWIAVKEIVGKVWPFVLGGIAIGALIHGYVPQNMMASIMTRGSWWTVPLAVVLGVPMYSNAAGIFPIIQALLEKGVPLGTALAFMMAVIGLSLPETIILRKVLKTQLILVFIGIVASGIMIVGFLFNFIL